MASIPDYRWGTENAVVQGMAVRIAASKPGSFVIRKLMPLDRKVLLRTRGRRTVLGPIGLPTLLLETTGRKSGQKRLSPLLYARDEGESVVVVGSNFGQAHHPAWTGNLLAQPEARVISGGSEIPVVAELLAGAEADAGWQKMVDLAGNYAVYKTRTDREIRVFRLTPS
ncbi:nitroreductase family deazaflavin-dependent oxidoreductase [Nocardioides sp. WS12]|uniref:nitroreductase family deazaflavin-dependent oxidoreductase n=1 Tax=Nocardioides sp. WS12 TaxID=2486272 RepID=UPI0015F8831A|nr:nitroreductase family deazaflavin-dependent oxidoreductase [Nocardioides sp. WS12]